MPREAGDLLAHSKTLRGYLGISQVRLRGALPFLSTIEADRVVEALAWAATRLESPYRERAIERVITGLERITSHDQFLQTLPELLPHFGNLDAASAQRLMRQLRIEVDARQLSADALQPFRQLEAAAPTAARVAAPPGQAAGVRQRLLESGRSDEVRGLPVPLAPQPQPVPARAPIPRPAAAPVAAPASSAAVTRREAMQAARFFQWTLNRRFLREAPDEPALEPAHRARVLEALDALPQNLDRPTQYLVATARDEAAFNAMLTLIGHGIVDARDATPVGGHLLFGIARSGSQPRSRQIQWADTDTLANRIAGLSASGIDVNAPDARGQTAVEIALRENPANADWIVPALRAAGADLELPDAHGNTLLHRTVLSGMPVSAQALLRNEVDVNAFNTITSPQIAQYGANPAALAASMTGEDRVWAWDEGDQATPLHLAAAFSDPEMVALLLDSEANPSARNIHQATPLHWACVFSRQPDLVRMLGAHGADINAPDSGDHTPLELAALNPAAMQLLPVLVDCGAEVNRLDDHNVSSLHRIAFVSPNAEVIRLLIALGADVNARDEDGYTPLHYAVYGAPSTATLRALLERGASVDAQGGSGLTPLHLAAAGSDNPEVFRLLLQHGANPDLRNEDGDGAVRFAQSRDTPNPEVIAMLRRGSVAHAASRRAAALQEQADFAWALELQQADDAECWSPIATDSEFARLARELRRTPAANAPVPTPAGRPATTAPVPMPAREDSAHYRNQRLAQEMPRFLTAPLMQNVERWYPRSQSGGAAERARDWFAQRDAPNAAEFSNFLVALTQTAEYQDERLRPALAERVTRLLDDIRASPELREHCFTISEDATASCGDRVTLALNNLEMARVNHRASQGAYSAADLVALRTGMFRLELLQNIAAERMTALRQAGQPVDEIELVLGYQTMLAERLQLPGVAQAMLYGACASLTPRDLDNAVERISNAERRAQFIEFIANWELWQQHLERAHPAVFAELDRNAAAERELLSEPPPFTNDNDYIQMCRDMEALLTSLRQNKIRQLTRNFIVASRTNIGPGEHK